MISVLIAGARPKTLPAAIVPVAVGTAVAYLDGPIFWWRAAAAMVVALFLQIGTNYVNDYADAKSGADGPNRLGPTRIVSSGVATEAQVKGLALFSFLVASSAGLYLVLEVGLELLPVGIVSVIAGWAYTGGPKPYGYYGFGELFVFIFFGLVATLGSYYVQLKALTSLGLVAGICLGLLSVALLVTNNLRDINEDLESNKKTLAVRIGEQKTRVLFVMTIALSLICVITISIANPLSIFALFGFFPIVKPTIDVFFGKTKGSGLISVLEKTGMTQLLVGALLTISLGFG